MAHAPRVVGAGLRARPCHGGQRRPPLRIRASAPSGYHAMWALSAPRRTPDPSHRRIPARAASGPGARQLRRHRALEASGARRDLHRARRRPRPRRRGRPRAAIDFDFAGRGGWAGARRDLRATLPEHFELRLALRGEAPPNTLEIKLLDPSGKNVWWVNRPEFELPRDWQTLRFKRRHFRFAWGPAGGGEVREVGAIEIVVTAGQGGKGTLWLDDLEIVALPPPAPAGAIRATSSPSAPGEGPERALDGDPRHRLAQRRHRRRLAHPGLRRAARVRRPRPALGAGR